MLVIVLLMDANFICFLTLNNVKCSFKVNVPMFNLC